jgi:solute carrier family 25 2-oxodicarboxylate transporter 21
VFPSLALIAREEGWRALYRGFVPKALRLGIGQSVGLVTFQVTAARLYARSST